RAARARAASGLLDHPGYVGGKLDLDVATAAQIDSLPGVGPTMAKRIAVDRMKRGPFVTRDGFRRVPGVGPAFLARIDSLVVFSGTVRFPTDADTIIPRARRPRRSA
ncbi:MAG TPA: helix-hairpin-helix domain-containing protein, partial [Gemmatimonadaceae bacterium]